MLHSPSILVLDAACAVIILVLASLSKGLGEALKIRRYYRLLYISAGLIMISSLTNAILFELSTFSVFNDQFLIPMGLRCIAGIIAVLVCLRYWQWLFIEFVKR